MDIKYENRHMIGNGENVKLWKNIHLQVNTIKFFRQGDNCARKGMTREKQGILGELQGTGDTFRHTKPRSRGGYKYRLAGLGAPRSPVTTLSRSATWFPIRTPPPFSGAMTRPADWLSIWGTQLCLPPHTICKINGGEAGILGLHVEGPEGHTGACPHRMWQAEPGNSKQKNH